MMPGDPGALPQGGGQGPIGNTVDGIACASSMSDNYHVHMFVGLYVNGQEIAVPDAVGIVHAWGETYDSNTNSMQEQGGDCFYDVHTHDASGMVHMESGTTAPVSSSLFSVANLLDIWGIQVNGMQFGPFQGPVTVYTSGQFSRASTSSTCTPISTCQVTSDNYSLWTGDPTQIPLYSHEVIWYEVGSGNPTAINLPNISFYGPK